MENDGELAWTLEICCNKSCKEGSRQLPHIGQLKCVVSVIKQACQLVYTCLYILLYCLLIMYIIIEVY